MWGFLYPLDRVRNLMRGCVSTENYPAKHEKKLRQLAWSKYNRRNLVLKPLVIKLLRGDLMEVRGSRAV